jgi:ubiquitin carboxyl-terminal hydrolase 25
VRPSQLLANAALQDPTELAKEKPKQDATTTGPAPFIGPQLPPKPPPLPARKPPEAPALAEHIEDKDLEGGSNIIVRAREIRDPGDTASSRSSQTLVDDRDMDSDQDYEKVEKPTFGSDAIHELQTANVQATQPEGTTSGETKDGEAADDLSALEGDVDEHLIIEQRVLKNLQYSKRSSGTEQQDAGEVMGHILDRLQAVIRPNRILEDSGIQMELLMDTFGVTLVNSTKKPNENSYSEEVVLERAITAYPAEVGADTLYAALDRNFDRQQLEDNQTLRYSSIRHLPPVLHVLIQRTLGSGQKNKNPVLIEEMLYLDRYMDLKGDPVLLARRQEAWLIRRYLDALKAPAAKDLSSKERFLVETWNQPTQRLELSDGDIAMKDETYGGAGGGPPRAGDEDEDSLWKDMPSSTFDFDRLADPSPTGVKRPLSALDEPMNATPADFGLDFNPADVSLQVAAMREFELQQQLHKHDVLFADMKSEAYRLHAVICHAGQLTAGHYWVFIQDFEAGIWRKYNDRVVTEFRNTEEVLELLNKGGDPYYLCYVRNDIKSQYVGVPEREPLEVPAAHEAADDPNAPPVAPSSEAVDVVMKDPADDVLPSYEESTGDMQGPTERGRSHVAA